MSEKDKLSDAMEEFSLSEAYWSEPYNEYKKDYAFSMLGEQWSEADLKEREANGQPCLVINRLPAMYNMVINDSRQNRPSIKVRASGNGATKNMADIRSGLIRHIEYVSKADHAYDMTAQTTCAGGFGFIRLNTGYIENDSFDQEILIHRVTDPLCIYGDENSTRADSADWCKAFVVDQFTKKEFEKKWKGAATSSFEGAQSRGWFNEKNIRVAEYWTREKVPAKLLQLSDNDKTTIFEEEYLKIKDFFDAAGTTVVRERDSHRFDVKQTIISGAEILEEIDWAGQYIPIIPVYGTEVFIDGKRYLNSLTKWSADPQRQLNYWRSVSTYLAGKATKPQFMGPVGNFATDPGWEAPSAATKLEWDIEEPRQINTDGSTAAAYQEAMTASDDLKAVSGIYDAAMGARSNEVSGVAIEGRARQSDKATFHIIDGLNRAITHLGTVILDLIPGVYSSDRILKVRNEDGTDSDVRVNFNQAQADGNGFNSIVKMFDLSAGKYQATVTTGPSYTTRRQETAAQMQALSQSMPDVMRPLVPDMIKNMDWERADEMADKLKSGPPPEVQQMQQTIESLQKELDMLKARERLEMSKLDLDAKKIEIDAYNADTNRLKVVAPAMSPQDIQQIVYETMQNVLAEQFPPQAQASPMAPDAGMPDGQMPMDAEPPPMGPESAPGGMGMQGGMPGGPQGQPPEQGAI